MAECVGEWNRESSDGLVGFGLIMLHASWVDDSSEVLAGKRVQLPDDTKKVLGEAIARNSAAVLTLPSAGMVRHYRTRFLAETPEGIWVEGVPTERPLIDSLVITGQVCGVAFKVGASKLAITVPLLQRRMDYQVNAELTVEAVLLGLPQQVKSVQRRSNYRVGVQSDAGLAVRVWRIAEHAVLRDRPSASAEVSASIRDISLGGTGLRFEGADNQRPKVSVGERLRVVIQNNDQELLLEGVVVNLREMMNQRNLLLGGVKFANIEKGMEGRQMLAALSKIVGQLQREEARRNRLRAC